MSLTSDQLQTLDQAHTGLEGLQLMLNEQTDLTAIKPDHLYFLLEPHIKAIGDLVTEECKP